MALLCHPAPLKLPPAHGAVRHTISAEQVARIAGALKNICLVVKPVIVFLYDSSDFYGGWFLYYVRGYMPLCEFQRIPRILVSFDVTVL